MAGFTTVAVITGVVCYVLGLFFGWLLNKSGNAGKVAAAYKKGEETATAAYNKEKEVLGEDLHEKLSDIRNTLVSTVEAYEEAVRTVDTKLSPGIGEQLAISYKSELQTKEIGYSSKTGNKTDKGNKKKEPVINKSLVNGSTAAKANTATKTTATTTAAATTAKPAVTKSEPIKPETKVSEKAFDTKEQSAKNQGVRAS